MVTSIESPYIFFRKK